MEHPITFHDGTEKTLSFREDKHWYSVDGDYVPSVTTILNVISKPALMPWAVKMGADWFESNCESFSNAELSIKDMVKGIKGAYRKKSQDALNIGEAVHAWCEQAIKFKLGEGTMPSLPDNPIVRESIENFRDWTKENDVKWLSSEEKVYNRKYKYAGTVDAVAEVNGTFGVIDFKTSKRLYDEYDLQVSAYGETVEDIYGRDCESSWLLRFDKENGSFEARELKGEDHAENFMAFYGALSLYNRLTVLKNRRK